MGAEKDEAEDIFLLFEDSAALGPNIARDENLSASENFKGETQADENIPLSGAHQLDEAETRFDEEIYLLAFPDVVKAIRAGAVKSATDHYIQYGKAERRLLDPLYVKAITGNVYFSVNDANFPAGGVEAVFLAKPDYCLIIGWVDDTGSALSRLELADDDHVLAALRDVPRCRRPDAEAAIQAAPGKLLGFWCVLKLVGCGTENLHKPSVKLTLGADSKIFKITPQYTNLTRLRETAFEYFSHAQYYANPQIESFLQLCNGMGKTLVDLSTSLSHAVISNAYCMRFGPPRGSFKASIVVCLYGKAEFLFLQAAFFSQSRGYRDYEFIYVSNSPELAETLQKEATIASRMYTINIVLVILPGNAGFGAANNIAVTFARSERILIVNPDVFPRHTHWAEDHRKLVENLPAEQTAAFGVPLYYDDGSLMHGGMFFDIDIGLAVRADGIQQMDMIRVEHYGKGAPPDTAAFLASRPVPAVTGAFMSFERKWFEKLAGFSLEYVFGHYEDADLCLKSYAAGKPVWLHHLPYWHLEGKGSTRLPVHEGGSLVNRWYFTQTWGDLIKSEFLGKTPAALERL